MLGFVTQSVQSGIIFQDGFESADMSGVSGINTNGFSWHGNNNTSVITQDPADGPVAVYNNKVIYNPHPSTYENGTPRDWTAFEGAHSLRVRYAPLREWSEQRYDIGTAQKDLWISFMLKVPPTYNHSPAINNKLFTIWMDGYLQAGEGTTLLLQYWPDENGSYLHWQRSSNSDTVNSGGALPHLIDTPADQGRWMQLVIHVKASSSNATSDGKIGIWRRWDGETSYTNFLDWTGVVPVPSGGPQGWKAGYLMGWVNQGFAVETEWQIDDFILSDTSLLTADTAAPNPPTWQ